MDHTTRSANDWPPTACAPNVWLPNAERAFCTTSDQTRWPPNYGTIDRELDIAISQFAPGAQSIKDDKLHTAVGVVEFIPDANDVALGTKPT